MTVGTASYDAAMRELKMPTAESTDPYAGALFVRLRDGMTYRSIAHPDYPEVYFELDDEGVLLGVMCIGAPELERVPFATDSV